jgi:periplasmic protein TonB
MLRATTGVFGRAVWGGNPELAIRVPTSVEAQNTVLAALLETHLKEEHRNPLDWFVSLVIHAVVITALVLAPRLFTQVIDLRNLQLTYLATPAPPAAPAPPLATVAVQKIASRKIAPIIPGKLTAPSAVPRKIVVVHDAVSAPDISGGVIGGVPGGITGGPLGGIIGGTTAAVPVAPPAAETKQEEVIQVGGDVKRPRTRYAPAPEYPALARSAHIQGRVIIDAIVDERGNVVNAHAVEGQQLLIPEALRTVLLWKYEPTYLNDVAYPVTMNVTVDFAFGS